MNKEYKYIYFKELTAKLKTRVFLVLNKTSDDFLGYVKWYAPWRRYCFLPYTNLVFDAGCLTDISNFLNEIMAERKKEKEKNNE